MSHVINIYEAKTKLSQLIERATAGEEIIIAKAGKPMVKLVPIPGAPKRRKPRGDFVGTGLVEALDEPLPPEIVEAFDRGKLEP